MKAYQVQRTLLEDEMSDWQEEPDVSYIPGFVHNHDYWFSFLQERLDWNVQYQTRMTHTFGITYNYNKGTKKVTPMPGFLKPVCERIDRTFGYYPNNCLVNYYPDGGHYINFHSDQDNEMKDQSGVAIISLGSVRNMVLRKVVDQKCRFYYPLQPGSVFFMQDCIQSDWQHGILKQPGAGARISLSFRSLLA